MKSRVPLLLLLGSLATAAFSHAQTAPPEGRHSTDGSVWGALVFATNSADKLTGEGADMPAHAEGLEDRLAKALPWSHFEVLGQHTQDVLRQYETWVVPSGEFYLKVDSKGPEPTGGLNLHIQFWRGDQVLVKTDTLLRMERPLFITGPKWREGQLIFVLSLVEEAAAKKK
jgi:hypothetical protein